MSRGATPTAVDVAIVNWNTAEAALEAARAYLASTGVSAGVTVIDNASAPPQREVLERGLPDGARVELAERNLGYGAAANRALAGGSGEVVCVSNADVAPEPTALAELARVALAEPHAGMVGPAFDPGDHYHARLPRGGELLGQIFAGSFMRHSVESPPAGEVAEVAQPSGACFAVRRGVWEECGGFDEGFFLWFEDVDLARRLLDSGRRNLVVGSARVGHARAASFRQLEGREQQAIRLASLERYVGKHHRGLAPLAAPLLALSRVLRARGAQARPQGAAPPA
jgi:N-acetylglucosaminyl-diphospho-decaprenol L-rhamnosyltransferase